MWKFLWGAPLVGCGWLKAGGQPPGAERENVGGAPQSGDDIRMGADQQLGVIVFAQFGSHRPGEPFGGERELCFDARLVPTWVLPVPTAPQVNSYKAV
jgi:hypothetical protein